MAVVIASDLAKDMAGEPLLRGVSFRLERRERLTLSGRNGSGKTTLLRMLAGETSVDGGELVLAKGTRVALHDQRPPRDRDLSLRDYVLSGAKELLAIEARLAELEHAMAQGATDAATLAGYSRAQARLEHAGGYGWREGINATLHGLGFRDEAPRPLAGDVLRRRAHARLAGARAGRRPRPAAARRADQPPRHRVAGVARDPPADARRRHRPRRPRPLVPRGRRHRRARARGGPLALLQGHLARLAQGEGGARARPRARDRAPAGGDRPARALRHALPRRHPRAPGAVARQAARQDRARRARPARQQVARLRPFKPPERSGRVVFEMRGRDAADRRARAAARRGAVAGARRARLADRAQRVGQDDADLGSHRRPRARRGQAAARATTSSSACSPSTPRSSPRPARCWRRPSARRS